MKIIYFGTPDFSIPPLKKILESEHEVCAVVTAQDKRRGRGRQISFTPVKQFAMDNRLPVMQPATFKDPDFLRQLEVYQADLFVVVAFRILPEEVFALPPKGTFNLHSSLLPKYRGAAPIQWALINGDKETGLTTFFLKKKVDTGNIILQKKIEIFPEDNFETLHDRMSELGAELVLETVELIDKDKVNETPQDDSLASPAPKITKEICEIKWSENAAEKIHNLVRGVSPYPGAFFIHNGKQYKVFKTAVATDVKLEPFEIKETKKEIFIGTKSGTIEILQIQPEGRKRMTAEEFLRGYSLLK
ncbi:MAG: methionyl-tRNA formyltransferase [Chlorobi bacterium]|nr:methionyl-tRNA formyltransferase [Chlorobiota bacterium]